MINRLGIFRMPLAYNQKGEVILYTRNEWSSRGKKNRYNKRNMKRNMTHHPYKFIFEYRSYLCTITQDNKVTLKHVKRWVMEPEPAFNFELDGPQEPVGLHMICQDACIIIFIIYSTYIYVRAELHPTLKIYRVEGTEFTDNIWIETWSDQCKKFTNNGIRYKIIDGVAVPCNKISRPPKYLYIHSPGMKIKKYNTYLICGKYVLKHTWLMHKIWLDDEKVISVDVRYNQYMKHLVDIEYDDTRVVFIMQYSSHSERKVANISHYSRPITQLISFDDGFLYPPTNHVKSARKF